MNAEGTPQKADQSFVERMMQRIESKMDRILEGQQKQNSEINEINVHLKYGRDRFDQQCERIKTLELRAENLEAADQQRKGHIQMICWIGGGLGTLTAVAVVVIMIWKG